MSRAPLSSACLYIVVMATSAWPARSFTVRISLTAYGGGNRTTT